MEDLNTLCADCVVISCCCQCLILQILIFVLLGLPLKMLKKTRKYAKKKFQKKRSEKVVHRKMSEYEGEVVRIHDEHSFRIIKEEREFMDGRNNLGGCMEEVEKVMEELSQNGEFSFGSFWGRKRPREVPNSVVTNDDGDDSVVRYQVIENG